MNHHVAEKKLDLHKLDEILKKNTAKAPDSLQGVTFTAFNNQGEGCSHCLLFPSQYVLAELLEFHIGAKILDT